MAVTLHPITSPLPDDVELAIVIAGELVTRVPEQRHAGFVVKYPDGQLWLYDLATHNLYRKTRIGQNYAYLIPEFLDPVNANVIIGFLAMSHHVNQGRLRYSVNYEDGEYFDRETGAQAMVEQGQGLTCATFVLETLSRYGFELVDRSTWPLTQENAEWQRGILEILIDNTSPPYSIDDFLAQFKFVGQVPRFRPEEAIGAAHYYDDEPLKFNVVSISGLETVAELRRLGLD